MSIYQILTIILPIIIILILILFFIHRRNMISRLKSLESKNEELSNRLLVLTLKEETNLELTNKILDNIPHGIIILDEKSRISGINESVTNLFYLEKEKVIGSKTIMLFNNKNLEDLIEKAVQESTPQEKDIIFYGDEDISLDVDVVPLDLKDFSVLILLRNTTQEAEFSKLRSQFVANVSHEMRTPLTSMRGYIETLLENDLEDKANLRKYLSKTIDEVDRLNFLIEDILNLSNIEYRRNVILKEKYNTVDIIKDSLATVAFLAEKNNIKIAFRYKSDPINLLTDEELFKQLVRNLLENSIFHGGKGIEINIDLSQSDSSVSIIFSDNGVGIDKKDLPYVFQRFYRGKNLLSTKKIGSGLGLSIVKHIVELHNGRITVSSIPNKETRFTINIPG